MTVDITIHIPALDHLAQVLEGRDLAVLTDNFHRELDERLDALARNHVEAAVKPVEAPVSATEPAPTIEPLAPAAPVPDPAPATTAAPQPTVSMADIRNACAALRDAGKLPAVQELLKEHGVRNLSALKPEQLDGFADGLRKLGAKV